MRKPRNFVVVIALGAGYWHPVSAQRSAAVWVDRAPAHGISFRPPHVRRTLASRPQIGGGALAAGVLGFVAWKAFDDPEGSDRRVKGDAGYTPNAHTAFAVASYLGVTVATYLIGRGDGSRGSFAATALGAAVATIPIALGRHQPYLPWIGLVFGAPLQAIGATLGYQLTRREP